MSPLAPALRTLSATTVVFASFGRLDSSDITDLETMCVSQIETTTEAYGSLLRMVEEELAERCAGRVGSVVRRKYRLERLLGVGGMAAVYEATHRNGSSVALKVLHPGFAASTEVKARFLREGYVANRIGHPAIVRVMDDDDDDDFQTVFLVLELLKGENLAEHLRGLAGVMTPKNAFAIVDVLLDVLEAAHSHGIIHRDIKPENLFVTTDGALKVLDFGIARILDGTTLTRSGQIMGTPAFMAPEQANGRVRDIDPRTDLWSVGATLFLLLSGRPVHEGETAIEQMVYAATQPARPLASVASHLPSSVTSIVDRALVFDRDQRWPSARAMRDALRSAAQEQPLPSDRSPTDWQKRTVFQGSGSGD